MIIEVSGSDGIGLTVEGTTLPAITVEVTERPISLYVSGATLQPVNVEVNRDVAIAQFAATASYAATSSFAVSTLSVSASYAATASYTINSVSSSYASSVQGSGILGDIPVSSLPSNIAVTELTSSFVDTTELQINAGTAKFVMTGSVTQGIFGVTEYIRPYVSLEKYSGMVVEYVAQRPMGMRLGMLLGLWSDTEVTFTDISTTDIGDTEDLSLSIIQIGNEAIFRVNSDGIGTGAWTVQSVIKLFPKLT